MFLIDRGFVLDQKLSEDREHNSDAGMSRVAQVVTAPGVFHVNPVGAAPAGWPSSPKSEPITAVNEAVVSVHHPGTDHAKLMRTAKMGAVPVVRNAAKMVAVVSGEGAPPPLLRTMGVPPLLFPVLFLFLLPMALLPLSPLGIGRHAHSHQARRAEQCRHRHLSQDTDSHITPP